MSERPLLLDVTRLISRSWTGRRSTGIDRVCNAYLDHFAPRAQAVVQHRGVFRILTKRHSDALFDMLREDDAPFRRRLASLTPAAIAAGKSHVDGHATTYINVSHTDFDLDSHVRWSQACGFRSVYLIHDLIPLTHGEHCRPHAIRRHRGRVQNALRHASGIIVNSAATANDLAGFSTREKLPSPPVLVARLAGASLAVRPSALGTQEPYFLCVGTIEPRKNHLMLLDLWQNLAARMGKTAVPRLIIVGQWGANSGAVRQKLQDCAGLGDRVLLLENCGDAALGDWIAGARALLMPTLAEGFGLPMVEALRLGTPVIASDLPCFKEIGEGIPTLIAPHDIAAWDRAILDFMADSPERLRQLALLRAYRPTSWKSHFAQVDNWLPTLPQRHQPLAAAVCDPSGDPSFSEAGRLRA
ncbi:glycosyltransferase family 1 protein [Altererythrobacter fulvus]|uniref:glycosyltransferase family 4 protein n=1 Tax=Caenibius fulvus TaxID=2126012 RepID=UPI003018C3B1